MKKVRFCLLILLLTLIIFGVKPFKPILFSANASTNYALIIEENCEFFADASLKIVKFYLPKNYAVKIVSVGAESSRVLYMDDSFLYPVAEGYVKNINLNFVDDVPEVIYPSITLTTILDEVIFADNKISQPKAVISKGTEATFYGEYTYLGASYVYVYINGNVGYMKKESFAPYKLPEVNLPKENLTESSTENLDSENNKSPTLKTNEILIFAVIIICAIVFLFFVLKPSKEKPQNNFFDDD